MTELKPCPPELRSAIFEVLRRHEVSEQCFAEVAMLTRAAPRTDGDDGELVGRLLEDYREPNDGCRVRKSIPKLIHERKKAAAGRLQARSQAMTPTEIEALGDERRVLEALRKHIGTREFDQYDWRLFPADGAKFDRLLDAGAYLDAAMMLVPEGWHIEIKGPRKYLNIPSPVPNYWSANVETWSHEGQKMGWGATPALALCAAIARAGGE